MHSLYWAAESIVSSVPGTAVAGHVCAKFVIEYCAEFLKKSPAAAHSAEHKASKTGTGSRVDEFET